MPGAPAPVPEHVYDPHQHLHRGGGGEGGGGGGRDGRRKPFGKSAGSARSRTTAGLTTFEDDLDTGFGAAGPGASGGGGGLHHDFGRGGGSSRDPEMLSHQRRPSPFKDSPDYGSDFSDEDSLGSLASGLSQTLSSMSSVIGDSSAGQIWGMLCALDDLVLEVKVRALGMEAWGERPRHGEGCR